MKSGITKRATAITVALAMLVPAVAAVADVELKIKGQVRARPEVDGRSFYSDAATKQYTDLRTRLGIGAVVEGNTKIFVQLQDSRRFGDMDAFGGAQSGALTNGRNLDVHQAYLKVNQLFNEHVGLQAGRFEVNLGNQRVFGAVGWHNVGRSWEGFDLWFQNEQVKATGYWLKRAERNDPVDNQDFDIFGANVVVKEQGVELFVFHEMDANTDLADSVSNNNIEALARTDIGVYAKRAFGSVDVEANGVYQLGTRGVESGDTLVTEQDIAAFLVTAEVGYTLPTERKARVAVGIDYASGDDRTDEDFQAYDNLYYTGHKFRGYMDYFLASSPEGLIDVMGRGSVSLADGWTAKADFHFFQTAEKYVDFEDAETSDVGFEIDLSVSTTKVAGLDLVAGLGAFVPNDSFAGMTDSETGLWGFLMLTSNFTETIQ